MKKKSLKKVIILGITILIINNVYYIPVSAKWISDSKNNWNWIEGKTKVTGWKEIDKNWYYFNEDGIMSTGWFKYKEKWYNLSDSGLMNIGWKEINGKWYHFNLDGVMSIGWIDDNGARYFTNSTGQMETGTIGIDGELYTFANSGALINTKNIIKEIQPLAKEATISTNEENNKDDKIDENNKNDKNDSKVRVGYVATNNDLLNIRSEATTASDIIGTIPKYAEVKITDDEKDGFYPILINGKKGWVNSTWISFEKPKSQNTSASSTSNSNIVPPPIDSDKKYLPDESLDKGAIRDTEPSLNDKHYYSDDNLFYKIKLSPPFSSGGSLIKGNCTWYAWGRAWEMSGNNLDATVFKGNAYEWWEANKKSGKYEYGSTPKVGAIAVWKSELPNSGGCGHVAIVEKIKDGKIYISESMWHGATFKYREIYETSYLYGYIYLDESNN